MKVLIIGGTSSLACALKPKLLKFSNVITAGRNNCDLTIDLSNFTKSIDLPYNFDVIINTAANFGGRSSSEIFDAENINVLGNLKLCEAALNNGVKHFILISSISAILDNQSEYFNIYALSKKHSEDITQYYCSLNNIPLSILRPSQIYGIGENFRRHQPFFYSILEKAMKGEDINLNGTNDPMRNYIYIDDLTDIIAKVIQNKVFGIYSCTQMNDVRYSQVAKAAYNAFNTNGIINFLKDKPNISNNIFPKDDTLYKKIGFFPQVQIEEGIKRIAISKTKF